MFTLLTLLWAKVYKEPMNIVKLYISLLLMAANGNPCGVSQDKNAVVQIRPVNIVMWWALSRLCKHVVSWASCHLWGQVIPTHVEGGYYSQILLVGHSESALNLLWIDTCCSLPPAMLLNDCVIVLVPCVSVKGLACPCVASCWGVWTWEGIPSPDTPHAVSMSQLHVSMWG